MKRLLAALLALLMLPAAALAQNADAAIVVATGEATVPLHDRLYVLSVTTRSSGETASAAAAQVEADAGAISAAIVAALPECEVDIGPVNIQAVFGYQYGRLTELQSIDAHEAAATVTSRHALIDPLLAGLDAAMGTGVVDEYALVSEPQGYEAAMDEAVAQATASAVGRARLLAESAGLTLGAVTAVREIERGLTADGQGVQVVVEVSFQAH